MRKIFVFIAVQCYMQADAQAPALQWQKNIGGSKADIAKCIQSTSDGGYIVAGYSYSGDFDLAGNKGKDDVLIIKLSSTGDVQWKKLRWYLWRRG